MQVLSLFAIILEYGDSCPRSNIAHDVFKELGGMDGGAAQCWSTCLAQMGPLAASPAPSTITIIIMRMIITLIRFSLGLGV